MLRMYVVETWLVEAMRSYNAESYTMRHSYAAQLHLTGPLFRDLVIWALQALPDEILVGLDVTQTVNTSKRFRMRLRVMNMFQISLEDKVMSSRKHTLLTEEIHIQSIIYRKNGPMIYFQDNVVQEQVDLHIGCTRIRMLQQYQVEPIQMQLRIQQVLT